MPFYKKDYYHADLSRVCDFEELIIDWCHLKDLRNGAKIDEALALYGCDDLVDHHDDFLFLANTFTDKSNLELVSVHVGGIDYRVLKLKLRAQIPCGTGLLFDSCTKYKDFSMIETPNTR